MGAPPPEHTTGPPVVDHPPLFWAGVALVIVAACVAIYFLPSLLIPLPVALMAGGFMVRQKRDLAFGTLLMVLGVAALIALSILVINHSPGK